ncbi:MAG: hypothetical protein JOZ87_23180 [Chloroflexi bacterium]|nr:hypothetical protein [Chloroflexota bacterium]
MARASGPFARRTWQAFGAAASAVLLLTSAATAQTPTGDQPRAGGTLRIGDWSEPATLNPYFSGSTLSAVLSELALDGLARVTPDGSYVPDLAAQIPTQANGDVSPDGTA